MQEKNYHPSTGTIHLKPLGELPRRTAGKRLGLTAFVLSWVALAWFALLLLLSFLELNVPGSTGLKYVVTFLWYIGIVLVPLFFTLTLIIALLGVFRPSLSGKIWSLIAIVLVLLTIFGYIFGYFTLKP